MSCAAQRAIGRLRDARDFECPAVSRRDLEAVLDDVAAVGRLIRNVVECSSDY